MALNLKKYQAALQYLDSIFQRTKFDYLVGDKQGELFLKRLAYFLKLLGNPEKKLKFIHVGGTSGKGSVATMIQSILTEAGYRVGLYTSPEITTAIEKIKIDNRLISPNDFVNLVNELKPMIDWATAHSPYGCPSYFEIWTALALLYFWRKKCDYVVLEVGLGGRYDATNIIPPAVATVINLIDYDHTEILGHNLKKIAFEKAGIIKPGTHFFTITQRPAVLAVFRQTCHQHKVPFNLIQPAKQIYQLNLLGQHQQNNAALAVAVAKFLGISLIKIKRGLVKVKLPCRLEIVQKKPLIVLDGAHNTSKMTTTLAAIKSLTYQKLYFIIALTSGRPVEEITAGIRKVADQILVTGYRSTQRHCYSPQQLAKQMGCSKKVKVIPDPVKALQLVLKLAKPQDLIVVTGSFYLAGQLRRHWRSETKILKERTV
ncbi:MAG: Mur ligase family protein [Patescibacteria group bacterium]